MSYIIKGILSRAVAVGPGAVGRDDRGHAGAQRHSVAGVRGGCVSADLHVDADLRGRPGAVGSGPLSGAKAGEPGPRLRSKWPPKPTRVRACSWPRATSRVPRWPASLYAFLNLNASVVERLVGFEEWAAENNPLFAGPNADLLGLMPFAIITVLLYLVGREVLLRHG